VFSAGGRFFSQAAPAPGSERSLGSTAPGRARQTVLLRCLMRSGGALAAASRRAIPSMPRVCRSALGGSSKPDGGHRRAFVREAIFRRLRNQAPTPNPHPFFSPARGLFRLHVLNRVRRFPGHRTRPFPIPASPVFPLLSTPVSQHRRAESSIRMGRRWQVTPEAQRWLLRCSATDDRVGRRDCSKNPGFPPFSGFPSAMNLGPADSTPMPMEPKLLVQ
jgi:hypothetical protein